MQEIKSRSFAKPLQEPIPVVIDYHTLQNCMTEAIKGAMAYERTRREKGILIYVFSLFALFIFSGFLIVSGKPLYEIAFAIGLGFAGFQFLFMWWLFTRWL